MNVLPKIKPADLADDIEDDLKDYQSRGITSAPEMCVDMLNGINDWHAALKPAAFQNTLCDRL